MVKRFSKAAALAAVAALAACTSGQVGQVPPSTPTDLTVNTLQFAVGTARIGLPNPAGGALPGAGAPTGTAYTTGTNIVATYRQPNGLSGTLVNSPTITGPTGWNQPAGDDTFTDSQGMNAPYGSGTDAGTTALTSEPQAKPTAAPSGSGDTFGQTGGVFAYGLAPLNSNNQFLSGVNFNAFQLPFFASASPDSTQTGTGVMAYESIYDTGNAAFQGGQTIAYVGGFPAYSAGGQNARNGTFPTGFFGYNEGFVTLTTPPVAGSYNLSLVVPTSATSNVTVSKTATLPGAAPVLGNTVITSVVRNPDNGATVNLVIPAGATETVVNFTDITTASSAAPGGACHGGFSAPFIYSVVTHSSGAVSVTLPGNTGPINASNVQEPAFCGVGAGNADRIIVTAVAADYPLYESGPPQNSSAGPAISNGTTADVSTAIPYYFRF